MEPIGCPETSVRNYHSALRDVPEGSMSENSLDRSKAWVCGRSAAGIAGSNPAGDMEICRECCVVR